MCMTPLHILSCNPNSTLAMIRELVCKCPNSALVKNRHGLYPVDLYLINKCIVLYHQTDDTNGDCSYSERNKITNLLQTSADCLMNEIIRSDLDYEIIKVLLAFKGTSMAEQLIKSHCVTGLLSIL